MSRLFDLHSRRDERGQMYLLDARLVLGDGSAVVFTQGTATGVPEAQARLLRHRKDLLIVASDETAEAVGAFDDEPDLEPEAEPEVEAAADGEPGDNDGGDGDGDGQDDAARQAALDAAREHLEAEGMDVPPADSGTQPAAEHAKVLTLPQGFTATTEDGEPRCLAAKADGTQCLNAAVEDTHACGLGPHKEKVAAAHGG